MLVLIFGLFCILFAGRIMVSAIMFFNGRLELGSRWGLRLPDTANDEETWQLAHKRAVPMMIIAGVLFVINGFGLAALAAEATIIVQVLSGIAALIFPGLIYFLGYRMADQVVKERQNGQANEISKK